MLTITNKDGVSRRGSSDGQEDKGVQLVYKTRAWRITTSHFWRISVATWNGSPSTNSDLPVANYYSARNPLRLSSLVILGVVARMFRCATRSSCWCT